MDYSIINWVPEDWYWSLGKHPEFKWECRVWRRLNFPKVEIYIGIGASLEEAIEKCKKKFTESMNNPGVT